MASQSTGIQQLLVAEKKAAEKVSDARKRKAKRLKQAKEEAQAEIEKYRLLGYLVFYCTVTFGVTQIDCFHCGFSCPVRKTFLILL